MNNNNINKPPKLPISTNTKVWRFLSHAMLQVYCPPEILSFVSEPTENPAASIHPSHVNSLNNNSSYHLIFQPIKFHATQESNKFVYCSYSEKPTINTPTLS
jgi:hypothetical protein